VAVDPSGPTSFLHTRLPARFILGGGMMDEHYEPFAAAVKGAIARATIVASGRPSVARAELGNRAGLVGAASAVLSRTHRAEAAG
jgi:hypothetical protein